MTGFIEELIFRVCVLAIKEVNIRYKRQHFLKKNGVRLYLFMFLINANLKWQYPDTKVLRIKVFLY